MGGTLYTVVILAAIAGCVAFLVWNKKKQAASSAAKPGPQKGIIR
jgi:hypothetical protein